MKKETLKLNEELFKKIFSDKRVVIVNLKNHKLDLLNKNNELNEKLNTLAKLEKELSIKIKLLKNSINSNTKRITKTIKEMKCQSNLIIFLNRIYREGNSSYIYEDKLYPEKKLKESKSIELNEEVFNRVLIDKETELVELNIKKNNLQTKKSCLIAELKELRKTLENTNKEITSVQNEISDNKKSEKQVDKDMKYQGKLVKILNKTYIEGGSINRKKFFNKKLIKKR